MTRQPIVGPAALTPEWFDARKRAISATTVARVLTGEAFAVYHELVGDTPPFPGNALTRSGQRHEAAILQDYAESKPAGLIGNVPLLYDPDCPSLCATPDAIAGPPREGVPEYLTFANPSEAAKLHNWTDTWGCEAKMSMSPAVACQLGEEGGDEIPPRWLIQCECQMAVTGWQYVDIACLIFGRLKVFTVLRNADLIDTCRATAVEYAERVAKHLEPPFDPASTANQQTVRSIYKPLTGVTIDLSNEAAETWAKRAAAAKAEGDAKREKDMLDAAIRAQLGNAEIGRLPNGDAIQLSTVNRAAYTVAPTSYTQLRYKKTAAKKGS